MAVGNDAPTSRLANCLCLRLGFLYVFLARSIYIRDKKSSLLTSPFVFLLGFLWGNSIVLVNTNIWCNILVAAKVFPVVKNQHLLLCTLLIGNSLAIEVCATGCNYLITFFIALCVENRMLLLFNFLRFFFFHLGVCFFLIVCEFEFCCDLTQWLLLQKLSFKCYVVQGLAYLIRVYAQTSIIFWIRLMMVWILEVKGLDSEHNQVNRFPQTPGEAKKSNNEVQQKGDNNPNSVANKLSGKRLVKPKRTI
ncbi:hypothetical protein Hdeb2414_s0006g00194021 [Helianthus debilis subsp. tardiflorus]